MILKKFGCEQFAGISDREFELDEHMNVIVGKNESGKTTMLDMIYHVLNTSVDLKRNEKKEFFETYMPAEKTNGFTGDCVDGSVTFETEQGAFEIKKEWSREEEGFCRLKSSDGSLMKSKKNVEKKMREELEFGQAVYRNLIFSSQNDRDQILRGILRASEDDGVKEAKGELASRVNQTIMELDGVSIEKLEEEIQKKIKEYENSWDSEQKKPKAKSPGKGAGGRREKNVGKILESYYAMEDRAKEKEQAEAAEENYEQARKDLEVAKDHVKTAREEQKEYQKYIRDIESRRHNEEFTENYKKELCEYEKDLQKWPGLVERHARLLQLKEEYDHAEKVNSIKERYEKWMAQKEQLEQLQQKLKEAGNISSDDYKRAVRCEHELEKLKASLKGMSELKGQIQVKEGFEAQIFQGADSRPVVIENGEFTLGEAFQIVIPDVMDARVYPCDIEIDRVLVEYNRQQEMQKGILSSYGIYEMKKLQERYERCEDIRQEIRVCEAALSDSVKKDELEELRKEYENIADEKIRDIEEIRQDISEFCDMGKVLQTLGKMEAVLQTLSERYETQEKLAEKIEERSKRLQELEEERKYIQEVPEKYQKFTDTRLAEEEFQKKLDDAEEVQKEKETAFLECERALPERTYEDIEPEYERAKEEFEKNLETCSHWKHILSVFEATKAGMTQNPSLDIQERTKKYLEKMTEGKVTVQTEEGLDIGVVSGNSVMNYRLLSEGTKETVALAFRLAVLENLYGEKKGFAVFDDIMIDMDPERRKAAAEILRKFSEQYQVIYVTCDPGFGDLLGGNMIKISSWY